MVCIAHPLRWVPFSFPFLQPVFHCSLSRKVVKNHKIPVLKKKASTISNNHRDMFYEPPLPLFNNNKKIEPSIYMCTYFVVLGDMSLGNLTFLFFYLFLEKGSKNLFFPSLQIPDSPKLNSHLLMDWPRNARSVVDAPNFY